MSLYRPQKCAGALLDLLVQAENGKFPHLGHTLFVRETEVEAIAQGKHRRNGTYWSSSFEFLTNINKVMNRFRYRHAMTNRGLARIRHKSIEGGRTVWASARNVKRIAKMYGIKNSCDILNVLIHPMKKGEAL